MPGPRPGWARAQARVGPGSATPLRGLTMAKTYEASATEWIPSCVSRHHIYKRSLLSVWQ